MEKKHNEIQLTKNNNLNNRKIKKSFTLPRELAKLPRNRAFIFLLAMSVQRLFFKTIMS